MNVERRRTAIKEHPCGLCDEKIEPGTKYFEISRHARPGEKTSYRLTGQGPMVKIKAHETHTTEEIKEFLYLGTTKRRRTFAQCYEMVGRSSTLLNKAVFSLEEIRESPERMHVLRQISNQLQDFIRDEIGAS